MILRKERIIGGIWGLLVGDAVGVPYEFNNAEILRELLYIDIEPPRGFAKTYENVETGTWSDDGAQALCLLDSLLSKGKMDINDFAERLLNWYEKGLWAVDNRVFDIGIQTAEALRAYKRGVSPLNSGMIRPNGKGNGALMRVLPLAIWHKGTDEQLVEDAHLQTLVTHGNRCNGVCCALYCLWARRILNGLEIEEAYIDAVDVLRSIYEEGSEFRNELEYVIKPDEEPIGKGSGYVVDSLKSVRMVLKSKTYEEVIINAILLGDDTDTTACIAGGLAGLSYGIKAIPERWLNHMRGKELVDPLIKRLLESEI
ncbi:ADP-ribosylation/Crystallin J1 [Clostridium cellulovorans 743B]|uniref:ADP-ribosylation/Crystallin J1 n=2 Tax=Clostridium cellulovorans TaxID=1493 RepID=D9STF8_CLOC7|nr:ADP-ribosylation/Crystallin J1 [Clostridium cellulovorans 743B]